MTRDDELADEDPSYFCDDCFKMLHYVNGKKAANFVAFPFISVNTLEYPTLNKE